jgi:peptide/nickel transport system permease protein
VSNVASLPIKVKTKRKGTKTLVRVGKQLSVFAVTLLGLLMLTFFIGRVMPVDPVTAVVGIEADKATYEKVYLELGLDQPVYVQFWRYVSSMARGDFGNALLTGHPVLEDIARVFPATVELATGAIIVGAGLGIPLGVWAAAARGRRPDHIIRFATLAGYATPVFWMAMVGLLIFYGRLGWVGGSGRVEIYYEGLVEPRTGFILIDSILAGEWDVFQSALNHIILPASVLGFHSMAYITRMTRSFMIEQLSQEYIVTARVKGLSRASVLWRHAFPNILVQLVTIVTLAYGGLLEGAVLVETVFAWPGFGQYLTSNLLAGDMNAAMGCVLLVGIIFITLNLISDLLYKVFDPRTRS